MTSLNTQIFDLPSARNRIRPIALYGAYLRPAQDLPLVVIHRCAPFIVSFHNGP